MTLKWLLLLLFTNKSQIWEFSYSEVWFTDQNSKHLEIEDRANLTLVLKWYRYYKICCSLSLVKHLIEPRDRIFVKGYGFLSFATNIGKTTSENLSSTYTKTFLIALKNLGQLKLQQKHLKLLQKEQFKKQQKQLVI